MKKTAAAQKGTRGRPWSIDRETVLAAAMRLADSELNLPALAESLGTTVTTIYRLFGDKAGLLTAMYAESLRNLEKIKGSSWSSWLDSYVEVLLKLARRYPFVVALQFSQTSFNVELRNLAERSLALVNPGVELLVKKGGLDRATAHNVLVAIKAIVFDYVHTERVYAESTIDPAPAETLGLGEQRLWKLLEIFRNGLRNEMK